MVNKGRKCKKCLKNLRNNNIIMVIILIVIRLNPSQQIIVSIVTAICSAIGGFISGTKRIEVGE